MKSTKRRIEIYDTTLRDGMQGEGISFSLMDKLKIAHHLDALGVDFIEGGYPLSNPKDAAFFAEVSKLKFRHARLCAFGMTRRKGVTVGKDAGMKALLAARVPVVTIVGKSWDMQVDDVLRVARQENLAMISESIAHILRAGASGLPEQVFFDAEHFFDGYRANRAYAMATLKAAIDGGATRLILCDTNGGSLSGDIVRITRDVIAWLPSAGDAVTVQIGIHPHNDSGLAVANALAAVDAGVTQVQGTINGIGERCGNVDLLAVVANLRLKMDYDCLLPGSASRLTEISRFVYETANLNIPAHQPFVGTSAFAHKGGMHVHAVQRASCSYEHVSPEKVGNVRRVLISELSGASNVVATLGRKFAAVHDRALQRKLINRVAELENLGYQFESAEASFELLLHEMLGHRPTYWKLDHYRCIILKREGEPAITEASVKLNVGGRDEHHVAEGDGPVNALDAAMRKGLTRHYPQLRNVHLRDFKVRVVNATAETAAKVRVAIEFAIMPDGESKSAGKHPDLDSAAIRHFSTIGVSENIIDAAWQGLADALAYYLIETSVKPVGKRKQQPGRNHVGGMRGKP